MLFERTCRIAQDFDWFLRFVPPNSVEKRKISKNHPETCTKTGSTILSPACLEMFEPSKAFSMLLYDVSKLDRQHCTTPIKMRKISKNHSESCISKQAARFFRLPVLRYSSRQRLFPCFFAMPANQNTNAARLLLKSKKQQKSSRNLHKKTGSTILPPACFGIFEPSKMLSLLLFMIPANQTASHCNQNQNTNNQRHHLPVAFP